MRSGAVMKSRIQEQLPSMLALAHERTESSRIELAGLLADVFLNDNKTLSLREQELVNELIDQLMRNNSPALRAQLVRHFTNPAQMPRKIAVTLAADSIEISGKILSTCVSLNDTDLITVVESQTADHACAIAKRESISEAVADALVTTGDIRVMQIVAENMGAKLTHKAVSAVADAARFSAALREPIMKRPEMIADVALRLYWWVSKDLRRYTLKRFGISSGAVNQSLSQTIEDMLGYHQLEKSNDEIMTQIADWLSEREALTARILPQVLRMGHFRLFNIMLSRLSGLDLSLIDIIVAEAGGRSLATVCRALGSDKPSFVSIFLLSRGARQDDQVVHPRELSQALMAFDRLSTNLANDLLRSWKADPSYLLRQEDDMVMGA
jgi:hypothetical protein